MFIYYCDICSPTDPVPQWRSACLLVVSRTRFEKAVWTVCIAIVTFVYPLTQCPCGAVVFTSLNFDLVSCRLPLTEMKMDPLLLRYLGYSLTVTNKCFLPRDVFRRIQTLGISSRQPTKRGARAGRLNRLWHQLPPAVPDYKKGISALPVTRASASFSSHLTGLFTSLT